MDRHIRLYFIGRSILSCCFISLLLWHFGVSHASTSIFYSILISHTALLDSSDNLFFDYLHSLLCRIWKVIFLCFYINIVYHRPSLMGGGPRVVVSTAAFHARVRGSVPGLGGFKETKNVSSPSMCESQYCGEPPWPRGSVLGLRPPGLEFRILCLEDSVISIISPSSGGSPGPV